MTNPTSVWIYGSVARGDTDPFSDVDIVVVSDVEAWNRVLEQMAELDVLAAGRDLSPIHFTWREVAAMAEYGSLFLHHVRLEGRPLTKMDDDPLAALLATLPPYLRGRQEIRAFHTVLDDVRRSIEGPHSPSFELAVIATALRHASILGCYVAGEPDFGRTSPFRRLCRIVGEEPMLAADLATLYDFRLYQHDRAPAPFVATTADVRRWLEKAESLFAAVRERVDDFDRTVHRAA